MDWAQVAVLGIQIRVFWLYPDVKLNRCQSLCVYPGSSVEDPDPSILVVAGCQGKSVSDHPPGDPGSSVVDPDPSILVVSGCQAKSVSEPPCIPR